jgi:signal transduction histidine kinase
MAIASAILAAAWAIPSVTALRAGRAALAGFAALVVVTQAATAPWPKAAPLAVAAWLTCALALPGGVLGTPQRRSIAGVAGITAAAWTAWRVASDLEPARGLASAALVLTTAVAAGALAVRCSRMPAGRHAVHWVAAAAFVTVAAGAVLAAVHVLLDVPDDLLAWTTATLALLPLGLALGLSPRLSRLAERALLESIVVAGLAVLVVAVYLVVVVGLGRSPEGTERDVLLASVIAALLAVTLALPVRHRLVELGQSMLRGGSQAPEQTLETFGARMSRAVPFDELMLQLAESLRATLGPAGAEVWVGTDGVLNRTVSVPERPAGRLALTEKERVVVGRTRVGGVAWLSVWLPDLLEGHPRDAPIRVAPAAYLGDLLGLLVVRREAGDLDFSEDDDHVLADLARQVGLALHNVRLDTALQASLDELRRRNEELQASRLRIVTTADAARRAIERDLHDGAQQHLVALSVKVGLARELVKEDPETAAGLLDELHTDVQNANTALRELAHGIYPPLLRNHGLAEALLSVTRRVSLPYEVSVDLPRRYPEEIEAAVYFCCLEAIQNATKHAGDGATIRVKVDEDGDLLRFAVADDGVGFVTGRDGWAGSGFVNMADRLGVVGGRLVVDSRPGHGTTVCGEIPAGGAA